MNNRIKAHVVNILMLLVYIGAYMGVALLDQEDPVTQVTADTAESKWEVSFGTINH